MDKKQYEIKAEPFWKQMHDEGADGYDIMEAAVEKSWHPIPAWGSEGWNLGEWPLMIIFFKKTTEGYQLAEYCEGDVNIYRCPTKEERAGIVDEIAFHDWKRRREDWVKGIASSEQAPAHLRGPYSRSRTE